MQDPFLGILRDTKMSKMWFLSSRSLKFQRGEKTCKSTIIDISYSVPDIVLNALDMLTHLILTAALQEDGVI